VLFDLGGACHSAGRNPAQADDFLTPDSAYQRSEASLLMTPATRQEASRTGVAALGFS